MVVHMSTVAVDFDGVIHKYGRGWHDGTIYDEPVPGAFQALNDLMKWHAVFIFTSRAPMPVANWITEQSGIECVLGHRAARQHFWNRKGVLLITNKKFPAIAYIDDRGIRFTDWTQTLADLAEFTR
jgi:hypothetical protein